MTVYSFSKLNVHLKSSGPRTIKTLNLWDLMFRCLMNVIPLAQVTGNKYIIVQMNMCVVW
jgi:hypothetical protein